MKTSEKTPILFILIDAFRYDYVGLQNLTFKYAPFLESIINSSIYVKRLIPSFGFCERAEIFTGTRPDYNQFFTALTINPQYSEFRNVFEISLFKFFDWDNFLRRYTRYFFKTYFKKIRGIKQPIYEIPIHLLPKVALTEDHYDFHLTAYSGFHTIFDKLRETRKTFFIDTFASLTKEMGSDDDREKQIKTALKDYYDLYLLYIGEGDFIGHKYGPKSKKTKDMIYLVDARLMRITEDFLKVYPEGIIFFIGDHGMSDVAKHIDFTERIKHLKKHHIYPYIDYDYFLDSTLIRIWFKNKSAEKIIHEMFDFDAELNEFGDIISESLAKELNIPPPKGFYGDFYWAAKNNCIVFPNFFERRNSPNGMHGYSPNNPEQHGFAIVYSKDMKPASIESADLIDVCPTLCNLLNLPIPKTCQGKSLL